MNSINCNGKLLSFDEPVVMGIINATPDSFYEGHLNMAPHDVLALAGKMITEMSLRSVDKNLKVNGRIP